METLSTYIYNRREELGMSASGLAKKSGLSLNLIEDIESGKELFLPVTVRQKLAKALKCQSTDIEQYEKKFSNQIVSKDIIDMLKKSILEGEDNLFCPMCGNPLVVRIAELYDLEDHLMRHPKAHCSKCSFQIKD